LLHFTVIVRKNSLRWQQEPVQNRVSQARRKDLAAGGAKNQKVGPHFQNTVLDVCSNQGSKREMGGHQFQMGGRAPLAPSAGDGLGVSADFKQGTFLQRSKLPWSLTKPQLCIYFT